MADIVTPALGESVTEATIARWTKKPGDAVRKDEVLVELDTDKVSLEVASPADGVLAEILTPEGATVTPRTVLGRVSEGAAAQAPAQAPAAAPKPAPAQPAPTPQPPPPQVIVQTPAAPQPAPAPTPAPAPPAPAPATGQSIEIKTPVMGESVTEGTLARWTKQPGQAVKKDEVLVEIETDKVAVEVSAPADGVLTDVLVAEGATVKPGQVIGRITAGAGAIAPVAPPPAQPTAPAQPAPQQPAAQQPLSPAVQRIVTENKLDPSAIEGTGKDGRVTKGDALAALGERTDRATARSPPRPPPCRLQFPGPAASARCA